jgi:DNA-binding NtrC family response regulator
MDATRGTVRKLFDLGEYGRILQETRDLELDLRPDPALTSIVAHASFEAGAADRARALASRCISSTMPGVRARAQLVLALCSRAEGQVTEASKLHQASIRSSDETADGELKAWTSLHFLRHVVISSPRSVGAAMLPTVRQRVVASGSPHTAAYLHATVAVGDAQAGRLREARRHCWLASRILESAPHPWIECSVLSVTAAISLAACDHPEATVYLEQLQRTAQHHRLETDRARALVNIGHLAAVVGDYEQAESALRGVLQSSLVSRIAKVSATETLARICLAQNRLSDCEQLLQSIERDVSRDTALMHVVGVQWSRITKARMLLKIGQPAAALAELDRLHTDEHGVMDKPLTAVVHMTAAHALVRNRQTAAGARRLALGLSIAPTDVPELQGQYYYTIASTLADPNGDLANSLRARARRIWASQGTEALEGEFASPATPTLPVQVSPPTSQPSSEALVVDSVASLLALGASPRVLAEELRLTINRLECSPDVRVVEGSPSSPDSMDLAIPQPNGVPVRLACQLPDSPDKVLTLGTLLRVGQLALELERLRETERQRAALWPETSTEVASGVIFETDTMREVLTTARRIAETTVPVLITGETGTGKEVLARLIHGYSSRAKASFIPFNCTSMSRDMIESQLFGHRKGSFTGATEHSIGVVRAANHGTLLLDEVGDMHLDLQPKLLRFLESGEIHPVGEPHPQKVDVRVMAATNADLKVRVSSGDFREDLYYRLSIVPIHLPPLRERRGEILPLARHYLSKYAREFRKGDLRLDEETMDCLVLFRWPGNIRQLSNEMRRVAAMAEQGAVVMPDHLTAEIRRSQATFAPRSEPRANEVLVRLDQPVSAAIEHVERAMVINALKKTDGLLEPAAKMLGLSRKGLYLKRQRYQIEDQVPENMDAAD